MPTVPEKRAFHGTVFAPRKAAIFIPVFYRAYPLAFARTGYSPYCGNALSFREQGLRLF